MENNRRKSVLDEISSSIKLHPETEKELELIYKKHKLLSDQIERTAKVIRESSQVKALAQTMERMERATKVFMESPEAKAIAGMMEGFHKIESIRPPHLPLIQPPKQPRVRVEKHYHIVLVPTNGKRTIH